ncbi:RING finger domain protein, putative [Talaromyces stipitatus ATCC 10500]|uniref:RING finger domain protein, putative n=1 Tax=Talaromyces stipitatus (strain ATCC 10500 / CBS 375.48 / QM 6759 / NRRL 1006) TaxID=441959 RepID=B8MC95_TALSN|nr:RING finger domain protein, putative [Talaromyces stipitatus ATCC 10500]EED18541.1 RING finger domain protein, putative [Talaromyces stipitatus ATCC 10500]
MIPMIPYLFSLHNFPFCLVSLLVFFTVRVSAANIVSANPTNDTNALTRQFGPLRFFLSGSSADRISLAPLTNNLRTLDYSSFQRFDIQGILYQTTPSNTASVTPQNIALISCDPSAYTGYLHVADTVSDVVTLSSGGPAAVLLYSVQSNHCNYTVNDPRVTYFNVFTIVNSTAAQLFLSNLPSTNDTVTAGITADMSTSSATTFGSGNSTSSGAGGTVSSSTTAVAMIILYTITGIITALFLGIIITGAVRAHRHPERYGPRNVTGRPRQSRAKGIARAMLETIPIVKFGDDKDDGVDAAKRDLEMASRNDEASTHTSETGHEGVLAHDATTTTTTPTNEVAHPHPEPDQVTTAPAAAPHSVAETGNNNCPICTDDFVKGQDVRLLPCNHQFHPECIDPWLINVSGTCPLCRIDLNPVNSETAEDADSNTEEGETQHIDAVDPSNNQTSINSNANYRHSRGLAGYLSDVRRARNAPVEERIEALRRLRESHQRQQEDDSAEDSQGRRRHLAMRLRDRFRIRTRQHGSES